MKNLFFLVLLSFAPIGLIGQLDVKAPDGNVVIGDESGTANPVDALEVKGSISATDAFKSTGPNGLQSLMFLDFFGDFVMNLNALSIYGGKPSGAIFCVGSNRFFDLRNSTNEYLLRVRESDGFCGVGTSNPLYKLHLASGNAAKPGGGMWVATSDKRSKKDINSFTRGLETLRLFEPVSYKYNGRFGTVVDEKIHIGLIAQDVEKIAPEMVLEKTYQEIESSYTVETGTVEKVISEDSYLSVDPSELTYILINSTKELLTKVELLEAEIKSLKEEKQSEKGFNTNTENVFKDKATLKQNAPNPFSKVTTIEYYLPETSRSASIRVLDLVGKELKSFDLVNKGNSSLELNMQDLPNGMYLYSLIVDGEIIDSKQMFLK